MINVLFRSKTSPFVPKGSASLYHWGMMPPVCRRSKRWINSNCEFSFFIIFVRKFLEIVVIKIPFIAVTPFRTAHTHLHIHMLPPLFEWSACCVNEKCERSKCDNILVNWPLLIISKRLRPSAGHSLNTFALSFIISILAVWLAFVHKKWFYWSPTGIWIMGAGRSLAIMKLVRLIKHQIGEWRFD